MKQRSFTRRNLIGLSILLVLLFVCTYTSAIAQEAEFSVEEQSLWDAYQSGDLIRLHILADSDDPEAQHVKLAVRDALLAAFGDQFLSAGSGDSHQIFTLLKDNCEAMRAVAEACAKQEGFQGSVTAEVGTMNLPEKSYGNITLPSGEYRALRITLGSGEGQNWWCVLFPQLCLAVASDEPWQTAPEAPQIVWDAKRIFRCWTLFDL